MCVNSTAEPEIPKFHYLGPNDGKAEENQELDVPMQVNVENGNPVNFPDRRDLETFLIEDEDDECLHSVTIGNNKERMH